MSIDTIIEKDLITTWLNGEKHFDENLALALLLNNEVVFLNSFWMHKELPELIQKKTIIYVICNDMFAWGCSDAEEINHDEIEGLYEHYIKDQIFGAAIWCCKRRNMLPQKPVYNDIRKLGIWDIDNLGLGKNPTW